MAEADYEGFRGGVPSEGCSKILMTSVPFTPESWKSSVSLTQVTTKKLEERFDRCPCDAPESHQQTAFSTCCAAHVRRN